MKLPDSRLLSCIAFLAVGALLLPPASLSGAGEEIRFSVTVPPGISPTIYDLTDGSGEQKLEVTSGGLNLTHYNFPQGYVVNARIGSGVTTPKVFVCNETQDVKTIQFYDCGSGSGGSGSIIIQLDPGECADSGDMGCVAVCPTPTTCPI